MRPADTFNEIVGHYLNIFFSNALPEEEDIKFKNYLTYSDYYQAIDRYASVLLLDHLVLAKNRTACELLEPLFLMIMSSDLFKKQNHVHDIGSGNDCRECKLLVIPSRCRMNFFESMRERFTKNVRESINAGLSDILIKSIENLSKDEYLLQRMKTAIKIGIDPDNNNVKGALTIFRSLQILGEVINTPVEENFVGSFFLEALLPTDLQKQLKEIGHSLSHTKIQTIKGRRRLESSPNLLQGIQQELRQIFSILEPVVSFTFFQIKQYILQSVARCKCDTKQGAVQGPLKPFCFQLIKDKTVLTTLKTLWQKYKPIEMIELDDLMIIDRRRNF